MFLWNVLLALAWTALTGEFTPFNLLLGFALGALVLRIAEPITGRRSYFHKAAQVLSFAVFFLWELFLSNLRVAYEVITPGFDMKPGIVAIPLDAKTPEEITLLANLITLTPGTLSLDVSADRKVLYIHAMYLDDPEKLRRSIKQGFERRVIEVLR